MTTERYQVHPATADRWDDLAGLFGKHGAYAGCWCMWFRWSNQEFREHRGDDNRTALEGLVREAGDDGPAPGLLAYDGDLAVGWCALAPRSEYPRLARSRVAKPVDDAPAWAVTCFYVRAGYRGAGVATELLEAATAYAVRHGAEIVEGYPVDFTRRKWVTSRASARRLFALLVRSLRSAVGLARPRAACTAAFGAACQRHSGRVGP
jgi:GNAT superfamily N-acetyltransferase